MNRLTLRLTLAALVPLCCGCAAFGFFDDETIVDDPDDYNGPGPIHDQGSGVNG